MGMLITPCVLPAVAATSIYLISIYLSCPSNHPYTCCEENIVLLDLKSRNSICQMCSFLSWTSRCGVRATGWCIAQFRCALRHFWRGITRGNDSQAVITSLRWQCGRRQSRDDETRKDGWQRRKQCQCECCYNALGKSAPAESKHIDVKMKFPIISLKEMTCWMMQKGGPFPWRPCVAHDGATLIAARCFSSHFPTLKVLGLGD